MPHTEPPAPFGARRQTVLIIDDDTALAETLALGLASKGYRTLQAADAATGWQLARAHRPDLVLCDVELPGTDGRNLLQDLRADPDLADRQFILMTGKTTFANARAAMDLGADDFLIKPFGLADMLRCVAARLTRAELARRLDDDTLERAARNLRFVLPQELFASLATILGLSEHLQSEPGRRDPAELNRGLGEINAAGHRLFRSLRNYVLLVDLETGPAAPPAPILGATAVADALTAGAFAAAERYRRQSDLVFDLETDRLRARPSHLTAIVEELVDNALQHSHSNTTVQVRCWRDGFVLQLTVVDAGRGLTAAQMQRIQESWAIAGPSPGLGLALVHQLVRALQGAVRLESQEGKGTTAYVTLPLPPAP